MDSSSACDTPGPTDIDTEDWSSDQSSTPPESIRQHSVRRRAPRQASRTTPLSSQSPPSRRGIMERPSSPFTSSRRTIPTGSARNLPRRGSRRLSHSSSSHPLQPLINYDNPQSRQPVEPSFGSGQSLPPWETTDTTYVNSQISGSSFNPVKEIKTIVTTITNLLCEILSNAWWFLRRPFIWLLTLYLLAVLFSYAYFYLRSAAFSALSPLCHLPGTGHFAFCSKSSPKTYSSNAGAKAFPMLMNLQGSFSTVLENSVGGSVVALDIKNSEMAVRDLNALVKASDLTCKEDLSSRLDGFVGAAKSTSRSLTRFSSRVNGVVDNLLAMDEYAIRALEDAAKTIGPGRGAKEKSNGIVTDVVDVLLSPFYSAVHIVDSHQKILTTFVQASSMMDTSIRRLIVEAESTLRSLEDLESRLDTINYIAAQESSIITSNEQETLADIWTFLGGNRLKLANFRNHKALLDGIKNYQKEAAVRVGTSLLMLNTMQGNLEELRDRVVAPGLAEEEIAAGLGDGSGKGEFLLEVHVKSIRKGVERLTKGMERAKGIEEEYTRKVLKGHDDTLSSMMGEREAIDV